MAEPRWKTQWPRDGNSRQWMRCQIAKASAIEDMEDRVTYTSFAIEELAALGFLREATRELERAIRRLPRDCGAERLDLLKLGAQMFLKAGRPREMESYLQRVLATKPLLRGRDKGLESETVHQFKLDHGLLDPSEGKDEAEILKAAYNRSRRLVEEMLARGNRAGARADLGRVEELIGHMERWQREYALEWVLSSYLKMKDRRAALRLAKGMTPRERQEALDGKVLWEIGFEGEAMENIEFDLERAMGHLTGADPSAEVYASTINGWLLFLIKIGKKKVARQWLRRVLDNVKSWQPDERKFAWPGVLGSLAEVVEKLEGVDAAQQLRTLAWADLRGQQRPIKTRSGQRDRLVAPLARSGRWKELREVLRECKTPLEAAEQCWAVRIALEDAGDEQ